MKVIWYNIKGAGHVNPTLPVVRALVEAGHEVWYSVTLEWAQRIEALGARFLNTAGSGPFTTGDYHPQAHLLLQLLPATAAVAPRLLDEARAIDPDLVVHDPAAVWGGVVARALGRPAVTSVPTLLIDDFDDLGATLDELRTDPLNREATRAIHDRFGQTVGWDSLDWYLEDDSLVFSCAELNREPPSWAGRVHYVGSPAAGVDAERELAEHGLSHLADGRRVIYVAFGTVAARVLGLDAGFFRTFVDALAGRDDTHLVISVGETIDPEDLGPLPDGVTARRHVPQVAVLQHADAFVTHAGANSVHEALLHEVPLVCVPCFGDQPYNAARVTELGAGVHLPREELTPESVRAAVERVTTEPAHREIARRIGASLRSAGGVPRAVELLERIGGG